MDTFGGSGFYTMERCRARETAERDSLSRPTFGF
jgi:hypothetical protein